MRMSYKCRAYPNAQQQLLLNKTFGCIRVVWNRTLAERQRRYQTESKSTSYFETNKQLTAMKKEVEFVWLNEVPAVPLQNTLRHQQAAFNYFFSGKCKYPRFKNRYSRQTAEFSSNAFWIKEGKLRLARTTEPLKIAWSWRNIDFSQINPTTVIVSRDPDDRWFVCFNVETDRPARLPKTGKTIGIDLGLKDFAVLSNGEKIPHPKHMEQRERNLKRYQRRLARCQEGSKNRGKAKRKLARAHSKVRDARKDFLHKASTRIVRENDRIAIENLNVSGMVKNRCLSKAISRTGWAEFRNMLTYKAERYGKELVVIDRWYPSSKTCSSCGHLLKSLSLDIRRWKCPSCGTRHDRDINAAKNIDKYADGLFVSASGGDVRRSRAIGALTPVKEERRRVIVGTPVFKRG